MKNRALFGRKYLDIQIREMELPAPGPTQALIEIKACGVCGTDLNFIRDWEEDYMPLGHEIAGVVLETGSAVTGIKPGTKVIVEDCTMCGGCPDCKAGHPELCRRMRSINGVPGMGKYILADQTALVPFDGVDFRFAALTEPLAVACCAVLSADIPLGGTVAVVGPGPIGLLCARVCLLRGAGRVWLLGHRNATPAQQARLALAEKLGCHKIVLTGQKDWEKEVLAECPGGVDRVIVTSPPRSIDDGLKIIRYGGTVVFLGLSFKPGENLIQFDVNHAIFNKITLKPSFAEPAINFPLSFELIRSGAVPAELFQTHFCSFDDCRTLFGSVIKGELPVIKPVFLPE